MSQQLNLGDATTTVLRRLPSPCASGHERNHIARDIMSEMVAMRLVADMDRAGPNLGKKLLARPKRFELLTPRFVVCP